MDFLRADGPAARLLLSRCGPPTLAKAPEAGIGVRASAKGELLLGQATGEGEGAGPRVDAVHL